MYSDHMDPEGAYAAVIPQWVAAMIRQRPVVINGDGEVAAISATSPTRCKPTCWRR
jgi:hypothetical protein